MRIPGGSHTMCAAGRQAWRRLFGEDLAALQLLPDSREPRQHLGPQLAGHGLLATALVHEALHQLLQAILPQAWTAFLEVLPDLDGPAGLHLAVDVRVHEREYLGARNVVRVAAAHFASFPGASPSACAVVGADGVVANM